MASFHVASALKVGWTVGLGSKEKNTYMVVVLSNVTTNKDSIFLSGKLASGDLVFDVEVGKFDRLPVLCQESKAPIQDLEQKADVNIEIEFNRQLVDDFLTVLETYPEGQKRLLSILRNTSSTSS